MGKYRTQIQDLLKHFPNCTRISCDYYEVPFTLESKPMTQYFFRVLLKKDHPSSRYYIHLSPKNFHSSLFDLHGYIIPDVAEKLLSLIHSDYVGLLLKEIIRLLNNIDDSRRMGSGNLYPKLVLTHTDQHRPSYSQSSVFNQNASSTLRKEKLQRRSLQFPQPLQSELKTSLPRPFIPPVPDIFPEIDKCSSAEIDSLLTKEAQFEIFFKKIETVQRVEAEREEIRNATSNMAQHNLDLNETIQTLRQDVITNQDLLQKNLAEYQENEKRALELFEYNSPQHLVPKLVKCIAEKEEKTKDVSEQFRDGTLTTDEFIKTFTEERKAYHVLAAKKEILEL